MTRVRLATFEDDAPRTEARATDASCGIGRGGRNGHGEIGEIEKLGRRLRFPHVFMLPQPSDRVAPEAAFVSAP
jgi:hypothetical protein